MSAVAIDKSSLPAEIPRSTLPPRPGAEAGHGATHRRGSSIGLGQPPVGTTANGRRAGELLEPKTISSHDRGATTAWWWTRRGRSSAAAPSPGGDHQPQQSVSNKERGGNLC